MSLEVILALVVFCFVAFGTPGPNNIMLMTSGVNYGFARTIPHILGIVIGSSVMCISFTIGLGRLFQFYPGLFTYLKITACIYLIWLSWRIAFSKAVAKAEQVEKSRPLSFIEAALFQWVNPKALVITASAVTLYMLPDRLLLSIITLVMTFMAVQLVCQSSWAAFGAALRVFLADSGRLRIFNICMGILLILTIVPIVLT